eukprot:Platyproteum_vivax@DN4270_c0_g1_i1.p1
MILSTDLANNLRYVSEFNNIIGTVSSQGPLLAASNNTTNAPKPTRSPNRDTATASSTSLAFPIEKLKDQVACSSSGPPPVVVHEPSERKRFPISIQKALVTSASKRHMVMQMCVKAADIAHPSKPWEEHMRWSQLLLNEFARQGDAEIALGFSLSPLCGKSNLGRDKMPSVQLGFISFVAYPVLEPLYKLLQLDVPLKLLAANTIHWETQRNLYQEPEKEEEEATNERARDVELAPAGRREGSHTVPFLRVHNKSPANQSPRARANRRDDVGARARTLSG